MEGKKISVSNWLFIILFVTIVIQDNHICYLFLNEDSRTYSKKFTRPTGNQSLRLLESGEGLVVILLDMMVNVLHSCD